MMIHSYAIQNRTLVPCDPAAATVQVFVCQSEQDRKMAAETLRLDAHDMDSALDPEEISRVDLEYDQDRMFIIWKQPLNVTFGEQLRFEVVSAGILIEPQRAYFITHSDTTIAFSPRDYRAVEEPMDVVLRFLQVTTRHFLEHLKGIKLVMSDLQSKISSSMGNKYLIQMFALSESLTYYLNAIEGNANVLTKLHVSARKARLTEPQGELLDDLRLDNQQCARQAQVMSMVLTGLMDARGNIINNNMNLLLRDLTLLNVIFLPLNLIASIGGMSEYSQMTAGVDWRVSYGLFTLAMIVLGWATWVVLMRVFGKRLRD